MSRITIDARALLKIGKSIFDNEPAVRIATCTDKRDQEAYQCDCTFFEAHRDRRFYIRQADFSEFADIEDLGERLQIPMQMVLVCQLTPGIHLCALVYYGKKYANVKMQSDSDVAQLLSRMLREQGGDLEELTSFVRQVNDNTRMLQAAASGNQKAN